MADYGVLNTTVTSAGAVMAAVSAIGLAWRGRTRWEPSEEDVAKGPQKVSGLIAAVGISVLYFTCARTHGHTTVLTWLAIGCAVATLVFLATYSYLVATHTYVVQRSATQGGVIEVKVIGGFRTTPQADAALSRPDNTLQDVLRGMAYDPDKVWPRGSRALAKLAFAFSYMGLTALGTLALAAAAMLLGHAVG